MKDTHAKEIKNVLDKANNILVVSPGGENGDAVGSVLALKSFLEKNLNPADKTQKKVQLLCTKKPQNKFSFLEDISSIGATKENGNRFTIVLNTSKKEAEKLSYEMLDTKLNIFITSKGGTFSKEDVSFGNSIIHPDVIFTLGIQDLDDLGTFYAKHTKIFYNKPIINIDTNASNEYFGEINIIDIKSTSICEILVQLFAQLSNKPLDEQTATALLSGIINSTNSFQNMKTTPKSFTLSAQLIARGANQQEIIKYLFKTKPLPVLKLWGRVLARIKQLPEKNFLWSLVTLNDFEKTDTSPSYLHEVLDELEHSTEGKGVYIILYEEKEEDKIVKGIVRSYRHFSAKDIASRFHGSGNDIEASFDFPNLSIKQAEEEMLQGIKAIL